MGLLDARLKVLCEEVRKQVLVSSSGQSELVKAQQAYGADHYQRELGLVLSHADGCFVWDMAGKRYLDCIATYSAIASGHGNIELIAAMVNQALRMTSAPNRFISDTQPPLLTRIAELTGQDKAILMNTGAEALDTAVKAVRQWGYTQKSIPADLAEVIFLKNNFHGRTLCAISGSSNKKYRKDFGPYPPGFVHVSGGNIGTLRKAITPNTAAVILEPIQGEGGIVLWPDDYLSAVRELCTEENVLLVFDEIQTGLGRTGKLFGADWYGVRPDGVLLGKALGQYIPVSAFAARDDVISCFKPGSHGSTFGGTALSCAVARKSLELISRNNFGLVRNSHDMGAHFITGLRQIKNPAITEVRGRGLFIGVEFKPELMTAELVCSTLLKNGLMSGVAGNNTVRFTPPLIITKDEIDYGLGIIKQTLTALLKA